MAKKDQEYKIGIMGLGMVGGALNRYFEKKGIKTFVYDKGRNVGSVEEANKADVIFVCVPTPHNDEGGFNLSYVEEACNNISGSKIVVIKSTVLPSTTEMLQKKHPQHKFLFNPEFLVEEKADECMQNPERQIIGHTLESRRLAEGILALLPEAPFKKVITSTEAEMVKYFGNTFLSMRVVFANQMYDLCQAIGIDYDKVKECAGADARIGLSHMDVFHGGYRGYGGKCLPKDTRSLIQFADSRGVDLKLHKTAEEINNKLVKEQWIEEPKKAPSFQ